MLLSVNCGAFGLQIGTSWDILRCRLITEMGDERMAAVFFDIDGTLWDKENRIPDSTKEAIRLLRDRGHLTFINSGRTRVFINSEDLLSMGFDGILSGCGTHIEYQGEDLFYRKIDDDLLKKSVRIFYEYDMPMVMEGRHMLFMDPDIISRDAYGRYLLKVMENSTMPIRDNEEHWEASKFSVLIRERNYREVIGKLEGDYDFLVHGGTVMEAVPKGCSKATAIAVICEKLGIDRKDTYAFGDSANDIDMLDYAGTGVAMGNGTDLAKSHADYVTDGLHEDGIYNALKHFSLI